MKRLLSFVAVALVALPLAASAVQDKPMAKDKPAAKADSGTKTASGAVTAVTADSVTVKGSAGEWTFAVDNATKVLAKGASTKVAAAKAEGKAGISITDSVAIGDRVTVKYHDGDTKHAASVRVIAKGTVK